jgi:hypothetical protein
MTTDLILRNVGPSLGWVLFGTLAMWLVRQFVAGKLISRTGTLDWRDAYEKSEHARQAERETNTTYAQQVTELTQQGKTTADLLRAMREMLADGRPT